MKFKTWLSTEEHTWEHMSSSPMPGLEEFLSEAVKQTLSSMQEQGDKVGFSFPDFQSIAGQVDRVALRQQNVSQQQSHPEFLAAHTIYEGPQDDRKKKGWIAYNALGQITDPDQLGWSGREVGQFKRTMTARIRDIASPMGFLFETEVFLHLVNNRQLHDADNNAMGVPDLHKQQTDILISKLGGNPNQILQFVKIHAKNLGDQIIARTNRILGCADIIWFYGGKDVSWKGRNNPADIVIGCSERHPGERDKTGYSIKFGSEARINVASFTPQTLGTLLGASNRSIESIKNVSTKDHKDYKAQMSEKLYQMALPLYENKPKKFVKLLNNILTGNHDTFVAARNYASPAMGSAEWSVNFQKDFVTTDRPGNPLGAKQGATVTVDHTNTYMSMTYKVPGGSFYGTYLYFIPHADKINVKVNNLTSDRR